MIQIDDEKLDIAVKAAKRGGGAAKSVKETRDKEIKPDGTIVTTADREAEKMIRDILTNETDYPILGEEEGGNVTNEDTYWVVDPIDGTMNYSKKQPLYGTAVALVENNEPVTGVIYMPELNYTFYAASGKGAYRNEEKITVSDETDTDCYYVTEGIGRTQIHPGLLKLSNWIQQPGSAVMAEGWLASGWCDAALFAKLKPWDIAAGTIIIREARGIVKSVKTGDTIWDEISQGRAVAGNEQLVDRILNKLDKTTKETLQTVNESDW